MKQIIILLLFLVFISGCNIDTPPGITMGSILLNLNETNDTQITSWKSHRIENLTLTNTDWNDIYWDLKIEQESLEGINFLNETNKSIIVIDDFNDIFIISGCVHTYWTGTPGASATVATRILFSYDEGITWIEARCLQTLNTEQRGANAEGNQIYKGSIFVNTTTWVKLQFRTSSTSMKLATNEWFDNPVAATITMYNIGSR